MGTSPTPLLGALGVRTPVSDAWAEILSADALAFVEALVREFDPRREALLEARRVRQRALEL